MTRPKVFLYDQLLDRILSAGSDWPRVLIWGSPGLGKSTFLECLQGELMGFSDFGPPQLIRRHATDSRERIRAWAADPKGVMLIDDLDRLFNSELEKSLRSLPEENTGSWRIIAAAGSIDAIEERADWSGSPSLNTFQRERLDPWERSWQARAAVKDALEKARADLLQAEDPKDLPSSLRSSGNLVRDAWLEAILEITGGHPALVASAFEGFQRLLQGYPDLRPDLVAEPDRGRREWRLSIMRYLEDYVVDKGMLGINNSIRYFKNTDKFSHLVELATERGPAIVHDAVVRHSLRDSGLAYNSHETGRLIIACELIRQQIVEMAVEPLRRRETPRAKQGEDPEQAGHSLRVQIGVVESTNLPEVQGKLRYETEHGEVREIAFSGGPWRILRCLASRAGIPVTVGEMGGLAGLATESATRSAIQRLLRTLRREQLSGVVDNIRGKGYRLGREPAVSLVARVRKAGGALSK